MNLTLGQLTFFFIGACFAVFQACVVPRIVNNYSWGLGGLSPRMRNIMSAIWIFIVFGAGSVAYDKIFFVPYKAAIQASRDEFDRAIANVLNNWNVRK